MSAQEQSRRSRSGSVGVSVVQTEECGEHLTRGSAEAWQFGRAAHQVGDRHGGSLRLMVSSPPLVLAASLCLECPTLVMPGVRLPATSP